MDKRKAVRITAGVVVLGAGVVARLAVLGLSVSEVVLCGAKNLASEFVKGPNIVKGESIVTRVKEGTQKEAVKLMNQARELLCQ